MNAPAKSSQRPLDRERPFPGPYSYREGDEAYFKGRDDEVRQLTGLVENQSVVLLYGASGLGKSSLLAAGLHAKLDRRTYFPITVRLSYDVKDGRLVAQSFAEQVMQVVRTAARKPGRKGEAPCSIEHGEDCSTLWEFFHRLEIWTADSDLLAPVIVLDQFEELFTLGRESSVLQQAVQDFLDALCDLAQNSVPRALLADIALGDAPRGPEPEPDESRRPATRREKLLELSRRRSLVKLVLSMREEYLPYLDTRPILSRHRLRLLPFDGERAAKAIFDSAGGTEGLLDTRTDQGPVSDAIVRAVTEKGTTRARTKMKVKQAAGPARPVKELEVDPSLLNLFCYQLNERRLEAKERPKRIEGTLVEQAGDDILSDFYESCLVGLPPSARDFVEESLLSPGGYRLPVPLEEAQKVSGINADVITQLQDRRLLVQEIRSGIPYLLIAHDVIARTIEDSRVRKSDQRRSRLQVIVGGVLLTVAVTALVTGVLVYGAGQKTLEKWNPEVEKTENKLKQARSAVSASENRLTQIAPQVEQQEQKLRQAEDAAKKAQEDAEKAKQDAEAARVIKSAAETEAAKAKTARDLAETALRSAKQEVDAAKSAMEKVKADQERLTKANDALLESIKALEIQRRSIESNLRSEQRKHGSPIVPKP